jgi:hypothetical protein
MIVVEQLVQTCGACPSQWEGRTRDGARIYVRYRYGTLAIGIGATLDAAIDQAISDAPALRLRISDAPDGFLEYDELRQVTRGTVTWPAALSPANPSA